MADKKITSPYPKRDLVGEVSGRLTITSFSHWHIQPSGGRVQQWKALCECGNTTTVNSSNFLRGHTTSCGCFGKKRLADGRARYHLNKVPEYNVGKKFGRLLVVKFSDWADTPQGRVSLWECVCECGNTGVTRNNNLHDNSSCGCWAREKVSEARTTHGMTGTPTYRSWLKMKERCYSDSYAEKEYYQDKGVTVCDRWIDSFENFYEDMGERPDGKTLNRIRGALVYSKDTCEWADLSMQSFDTGKHKNSKSVRTGVYLNDSGTYSVSIRKDGYLHNLGTYSDLGEAIKKREEAEIKFFGFSKKE